MDPALAITLRISPAFIPGMAASKLCCVLAATAVISTPSLSMYKIISMTCRSVVVAVDVGVDVAELVIVEETEVVADEVGDVVMVVVPLDVTDVVPVVD